MKVFITLILIFASTISLAQPDALHLGNLIDMPTARHATPGQFEAELRMYNNGGLLTTITIGIMDRFEFGISYGGENIIGTGEANMNPRPELHVRCLFKDEQFLFPAILVGFHSQGYGPYSKFQNRYALKSKGIYIVASKNTSFLGGLGIHGGVNKSLETDDGDSDINSFGGCHKQIGSALILLCDYDMALNDNGSKTQGSGEGYFNAGVRWSLAQQVYIDFAWKNIFENVKKEVGTSREVKLSYITNL